MEDKPEKWKCTLGQFDRSLQNKTLKGYTLYLDPLLLRFSVCSLSIIFITPIDVI